MISLIAPSPSLHRFGCYICYFLMSFLNFAINKYDIEKLNAAIIVNF